MNVSIAMATYNGAAYIREQLESFAKQKVLPFELVVCDDKSSDSTCDLIEEFARSAPFRVRLYRNEENLGYSQNFSRAMSLCEGDIVFLSDQDDVWLPEKISSILLTAELNLDKQLFIHDLEFCNESMLSLGQTKISRMAGSFNLMDHYVVGMATAVRRPFLDLCLPVPNQKDISHDSWLHDCANLVKKKHISHEVLAQYRRHRENVTGDGVLNVGFSTSKLYFTRLKFTSKNKRGVSVRISKLQALSAWLERNRGAIESNGYSDAKALQDARSMIDADLSQSRMRAGILSVSRPRRLLPVVSHFLRGGYKNASGFRSAVKDILVN